MNGVDISSHFTQDSWTVTQSFGRQGSTATLYLTDDFGQWPTAPRLQAHATPMPQGLQSVVLTETYHQDGSASNTVLYSGSTKTPILSPLAPTYHEWQLDCLDHTDFLDNIIVNGEFIGRSADYIVRALALQANIGLTVNHVSAGPVLGHIQINYITLSAALIKIAKLASQINDYGWFVDYSYDLHFFSFRQAAVPVVTFSDALTPASPMTLTFGGISSDAFAYETDGGSLRNSCIVRGANYQGTRIDEWRADGRSRSWPLTRAVDTTTVPKLTIGGVATIPQVLSVGVAPTTAAANPYEISQNANGQWFLIARGLPPSAGQTISMNYLFIAPIIVRVDNHASQLAHNGPNHGVFQMAVVDSSLTDVAAATGRGRAELTAYQWEQERVTFTTLENWPGHVNAGDVINLVLSRVPDSARGMALGITGTFMILTSTYVGVSGNYRKYTITATRIT